MIELMLRHADALATYVTQLRRYAMLHATLCRCCHMITLPPARERSAQRTRIRYEFVAHTLHAALLIRC